MEWARNSLMREEETSFPQHLLTGAIENRHMCRRHYPFHLIVNGKCSKWASLLGEMILKLKPPPPLRLQSSSRAAHKGTISKWQINVAALKLAERQRKRKEGREWKEEGMKQRNQMKE